MSTGRVCVSGGETTEWHEPLLRLNYYKIFKKWFVVRLAFVFMRHPIDSVAVGLVCVNCTYLNKLANCSTNDCWLLTWMPAFASMARSLQCEHNSTAWTLFNVQLKIDWFDFVVLTRRERERARERPNAVRFSVVSWALAVHIQHSHAHAAGWMAEIRRKGPEKRWKAKKKKTNKLLFKYRAFWWGDCECRSYRFWQSQNALLAAIIHAIFFLSVSFFFFRFQSTLFFFFLLSLNIVNEF